MKASRRILFHRVRSQLLVVSYRDTEHRYSCVLSTDHDIIRTPVIICRPNFRVQYECSLFRLQTVTLLSKLSARRPPLPSKNNLGSSHPYSRKYGVSGWYLSKITNLCLRTDFCYIPIHTSSICNNVLHDLTLIKMKCRSLRGYWKFLNYSK